MSEPASNGRALEYQIVRLLNDQGAVPLGATANWQRRDAAHWNSRAAHVRTRFIEASGAIVQWITTRTGGSVLTVERMGDQSGDVVDIVVVGTKGRSVRLSVKHNHFALKHPRPYSLAIACGFRKQSAEDERHRSEMKVAADRFRDEATRLRKTRYNELELAKIRLYRDTVRVCADAVTRWCMGSPTQRPDVLFQFLVGSGFHKVIVSPVPSGMIQIQDFSGIPRPNAVCASAPGNGSHLRLDFDNGWVIDCRIHTAKTLISAPSTQLSLKFDALKHVGDVSTENLE
ncbi:MAG: HaeIII family restriction endonuclease [Phycisphaerales bacterium]|nr:HaeIII family restriction endonuclease [Phycisphaerales bacterium]